MSLLLNSRPSRRHTIERKRNSCNYEPSNCIWATRSQNNSNKRNNVMVNFNGASITVKQAADISGIKYMTLLFRLRRGWTAERAMKTPTDNRFSH